MTPSTDRVDDLEEVEGRLYRPDSAVQSDEVAVLVGAEGAAAGVVLLLVPESLEFDLLESDDDPESVDDVVLVDDEDFDLPPRLSVL